MIETNKNYATIYNMTIKTKFVENFPQVLLVDLDGTVAGFEEALADIIGQQSNGKWYIEPQKRKTRSIKDDYANKYGPQAADMIRSIMAEPGFYREFPVYEDSYDALHELEAQGWMIVFCTSPHMENPTCSDDKYAWVEEHFSLQWAKQMIITRQKTLAVGRILIDDRAHPHNTIPSWQHLIFDQPTNQNLHGPRLLNWKDAPTNLLLAEALL